MDKLADRLELRRARDLAEFEHGRFGRGQPEVGVVLVVPQQDVVLGRSLLDEMVLERQGLDDGVGDDELEAADVIE